MNPKPRWRFCCSRALYPLFLGGLAFATACATLARLSKPVLPPLPRWRYPDTLELSGYRVEPLGNQAGFSTRLASHGPLRRFRLQPQSHGLPLVLNVMAVRSYTVQDLAREAFGDPVPNQDGHGPFLQQRLVTLAQKADQAGSDQSQELALGRGPADSAGSTTGLQTCLTPGGQAAVSSTLLISGLKQERNRELQANVLGYIWRYLAGEPWSRWECLVVQLRTDRPGNHQNELEKAWQQLQLPLAASQR